MRNLSLKAEDEFDDKLYSAAKKKGLTKSAFMRIELDKILNKEGNEGTSSDIRELTTRQLDNNITDENNSALRELVNTGKQPKIEIKELKPVIDINKNNTTSDPKNKSIVDIWRNNNMGQDEQTEYMIEKKVDKLFEQRRFNETFGGLDKRIKEIGDKVCEDGNCTTKGITEINKRIDEVCKDNQCIKSDLGNISKQLEDILKQQKKKYDVCPMCGYSEVPYLATRCPQCGQLFGGWTDPDTGNPVTGWKPYDIKKPDK